MGGPEDGPESGGAPGDTSGDRPSGKAADNVPEKQTECADKKGMAQQRGKTVCSNKGKIRPWARKDKIGHCPAGQRKLYTRA